MLWSDVTRPPNRRVLRQFAALWLLFFLALAARHYFWRANPTAALLLAGVAVLIGLPGLLHPPLVRWVFVAAMLAAFPIGWAVSLLALAVLYFLVLTPFAVFFRLRGRDHLGRKPAPGQSTFWEPKRTPLDLRSYFRQY